MTAKLRVLMGLIVAMSAIAGMLSFSGPANAAGDVVWQNYDVTISVRKDGTLHIVERQVVEFGFSYYSSGYADIPMGRVDAIENVKVSEVRNGKTIPFEEASCCSGYVDENEYVWGLNGGYTSIEYGFERAHDETRTFILEYDVIGAVRVYDENVPPNQQIWWTAIGTEVTEVAPVLNASVTLILPEAVNLDETVLTDNEIKQESSDYTKDGKTWTWPPRAMEEGDSFIVRLQIPPILAATEPKWQQADDARRRAAEKAEERKAVMNSMFLAGGLLTLVGGGMAAYGLWFVRGRDPQVGLVADFIANPPDDLPPGAAGALVDEVVNQRDIVATLADLARRGVISMTSGGKELYGYDVDVTLTNPSAELAPFEKEALNGLFSYRLEAGTTVKLWNASNAFSKTAAGVRSLLYQELVKRGYFTSSPEEERTNWRNRGLRLLIWWPILGAAAWLIFFRETNWIWFPIVGLEVIWLAIYLMSGALPKKTLAGAEAAAKWRAFRRYLEDIRKYEKLDEKNEIFDRYLPYAIAFGLEETWVSSFAETHTEAPKWYAPTWQGGSVTEDDRRWSPRRDHRDWTTTIGRSWWDVSGGDAEHDSKGGDGKGFSLPDWQGTSDHAGRALSNASNGLLGMFNTAGRALGSIAEAAAESDWGSSSSSGGSRRSSSSGRSRSFGGGGRRGGSSGGGRRGFR
jgi:uncharacterized membrane protein YgcG